MVRGARDGLELWWWVVTEPRSRAGPGPAAGPIGPGPMPEPAVPPQPPMEVLDLKFDLEDVLLPYLDRDVPMPAPDRARWRAAGLRVVAVPVADLDRLQSLLRTVGPSQRQWLGERPDWTDAVTGPSFDGECTLRTGERAIVFPAGALRLLLRCWMAPTWDDPAAGPGAVLRVELVPEYRSAEAMHARRPQRLSPTGVDEAGAVGAPLPGLLARLALRDGEACLIVPDAPEADWTVPPVAQPGAPGAFGPPAPPTPTIGEAMLSSGGSFEGGSPLPSRRVRVVLVLVPRVPERFQLATLAPAP